MTRRGQINWQRAQAVAGNADFVRRIRHSMSSAIRWGEGKDHSWEVERRCEREERERQMGMSGSSA